MIAYDPLPLNCISSLSAMRTFQGGGGHSLFVWTRRAELFQRNSAVQQNPIPLVLDWKLEGAAMKPTNCPIPRPLLCIAGSNKDKGLSRPVRFGSDPQKVGDYGEHLSVDEHNLVRKASATVTEFNCPLS